MIDSGQSPFDNMLLTIIHDLRSALRKSTTNAQLLDRAVRDERQAELASAIVRANRETDLILTRLSEYANAGQASFARPVPIEALLLTTVPPFQARARAAGGSLSTDLNCNPDRKAPRAAERILSELLDNAIKFRDGRPPEVRLRFTDQPAAILFSVTDNGAGIRAEYFEKVRRPFGQLYSRDEYPGVGLGLAICDRLLTGLNGSMSMETGHAGTGLAVHVILPCSD